MRAAMASRREPPPGYPGNGHTMRETFLARGLARETDEWKALEAKNPVNVANKLN